MTHAERRQNYRRSSREARIALLGWIVTLCWVVGVSWWLGQERPTPLWFGIPHWVLFGVALPWVATFAFNTWFSACYLSQTDRDPETPATTGRSRR